METKYLITLVLISFFCKVQAASSLSQPQTQLVNNQPSQPQSIHPNQQPHVVNSEQDHIGIKSAGGEAPYSQYTYRGSNGAGAPTYQNYPAASYARDVYGSSRDAAGNQIMGISSNADIQLSAYFGQVFWGIIAVTATIIVCFWLIKFFVGTDLVGGLVEKIKDSGATGKSLDLDRLTNMVYQAFDSYGKWAAKEARYVVETNQKGR